MSLEKALAGNTGRSRQLGGAVLSEQISMSRYMERVKGLGEMAGDRKTARSLLNGSVVAGLTLSGLERFCERGGLLC